jgi:hypothetical protein
MARNPFAMPKAVNNVEQGEPATKLWQLATPVVTERGQD